MTVNRHRHFLSALTALLTVVGPAAGGVHAATPALESDRLSMRLTARTPQQMAAFYEARGFPPAALAEIQNSCFITVGIRNKSDDVIWLEPGSWRLIGPDGEIRLRTRGEWSAAWAALGLAPAQRATFGWTLLPERRDLRPDEPVGGNITLAPVDGPFTLEARFVTGRDRRGHELLMRFDGLRCARDAAP